jgi:uncharacterized protein
VLSQVNSAKYANSPQYLNVWDLYQKVGIIKNYDIMIIAGDDLQNYMEGIEEGQEIHIVVTLEAISGGMYLTGEAQSQKRSTCSRCLKVRDEPITLPLAAFYAYSDDLSDDEDTENADLYKFVNNHYIDLLEIVRDALFDALEFNPLCDTNCQGLLGSDTLANSAQFPADSRFATLADLRDKLGVS